MVAVELQHDGATPRKAGDVRWAEPNRVDQPRQAVRVVRKAEVRGNVRGSPRSRLVPGHHGELVRQVGQLRLPPATVYCSTVDQYERRSLSGALIGDHEPVHSYDLHGRNVHPVSGRLAARQISETVRLPVVARSQRACEGVALRA